MKLAKFIPIVVIFLNHIAHGQTPGGGVTDVDGNTYQSVIIGTQEWMSENLKTSKYSNGNNIFNETDQTTWLNLTSGAWVYYNNDSQFDIPFGKLYNWHAVSDTRNICPNGWHVPSDLEWMTLVNYLGGENVAGTKMKSVGTQFWQSPNTGTNESGFTGLPGGNRSGSFLSEGLWGYWWSSTEFNSGGAWLYSLNYNFPQAIRNNPGKVFGYSVRCINDIPLEIIELKNGQKSISQIVDLMGRQTEFKMNTPLIYIYNDGSREKVFVVQENE